MRKILRRALAIVLTAVTIVQPMAGYPSIAKAADDNASISINGYQISSIVEGYRTIYTLSDSKSQVAVNSDGSAKVGLIYGIGDSVSNADTDLVIGNVGGNIINSSASITGKSDINYSKDSSDQSYVMTMKFGDGVSAAFYNAKIYIRAYAQLKDGSYIYSNAKSLTIYKLADYLYKNIMMSNAQGHSYLYDSILSVTNSSYKEISYDWNHAIVPAESSTPKPTVAPTTAKVKVGTAKVKSASKKKASAKAKISLKKVKGATKYQVQISTSKNFKKVLVKKTVKKLSFTVKSSKIKNKKKLYVRAKAIKVVGKKSYTGKWSKAKKVKVK